MVTIQTGEFGEVCKGEMKEGKKEILEVAVKTLKNGASLVDQTNFLREACTMAQFHHQNIVKLIGVQTKSSFFFVIYFVYFCCYYYFLNIFLIN